MIFINILKTLLTVNMLADSILKLQGAELHNLVAQKVLLPGAFN